MNAESEDEVFEEVAETGAGAGGSAAVPSPEPEGQTAAEASPWWQAWCDRIGAGEENLDATRTTLALQLQAHTVRRSTVPVHGTSSDLQHACTAVPRQI